jgi:hypothetical protein
MILIVATDSIWPILLKTSAFSACLNSGTNAIEDAVNHWALVSFRFGLADFCIRRSGGDNHSYRPLRFDSFLCENAFYLVAMCPKSLEAAPHSELQYSQVLNDALTVGTLEHEIKEHLWKGHYVKGIRVPNNRLRDRRYC